MNRVFTLRAKGRMRGLLAMRRRNRRLNRRRGAFQLGRSAMGALIIAVLVLILLRLLGYV